MQLLLTPACMTTCCEPAYAVAGCMVTTNCVYWLGYWSQLWLSNLYYVMFEAVDSLFVLTVVTSLCHFDNS